MQTRPTTICVGIGAVLAVVHEGRAEPGAACDAQLSGYVEGALRAGAIDDVDPEALNQPRMVHRVLGMRGSYGASYRWCDDDGSVNLRAGPMLDWLPPQMLVGGGEATLDWGSTRRAWTRGVRLALGGDFNLGRPVAMIGGRFRDGPQRSTTWRCA